MSNTLYIHTVIDGAYFENKIINTKGKLFGFGFGFGLLTKAGLFKFNYSNGKTENQTFKFSEFKNTFKFDGKFLNLIFSIILKF